MTLPDEVYLTGVFRVTLYLFVVIIVLASRQWQHWRVLTACILALASNAALLAGHLSLSGLVGAPFVAVTAWIFIDHIRSDPHLMKSWLGAKESEWSKERHDLLSELAAAKGMARFLRSKYEPEDPAE